MSKMKYNRGWLYMADLPEVVGSVQSGYRPVLVISNTLNNKYSPNVTIVPLTTAKSKTVLPTHLNVSGFNLKEESTFLCEAVTTIDKSLIVKELGEIDEEILREVEKRVAIQLNLRLA